MTVLFRLPFFTLALTCLLAGACNKKTEQPDKPATAVVADSFSQRNPRDSVIVEIVGRDSVTVLDLLTSTHKVDYKSTTMGVFVYGIDSVKNNSSTFWIYSVNDTMPKLASDKMLTRTGDRIVWHFRKMSKGSE